MDSSKNKKVFKKMIPYRRKFTSKKILGTFCHATPSGNIKHQITTLLQNNKTLALALQETRSELSAKQKVLDEFLEYLNKMKCARFRMLEISSTLKSLAKDCDETILLLTVDDTKWLDLDFPAQFCKKWETKLDKLDESCREVTGLDSMSVNEGVGESARKTAENSSNQIISEIDNACTTEELFEQDEAITKSNCSTDECESANAVVPATLHGGMRVKDGEKGIPIPLKSAVCTEMLPELKFDSSDKNSLLPAENVSRALANPSSLQKRLKSKIPLFSSKTKIVVNSSEFTIKEKPTKRKSVKIPEEADSDTFRRKTFVVKDAKHLCLPNLDVNVKKGNLDPENLLNENMTNISSEMDSTINNRKTFVVTPAGISEDIHNLPCCSRKTFVKKSSFTKKKSYIDEEKDTITSPKHKSTFISGGESLNKVSDQINNLLNNINFCSDEKKIAHTAVDRNEDSESISEKNAEEFQSNDEFPINLNMPKKNHFEELSQDNKNFLLSAKLNKSEGNNWTTKEEDSDLQNVNVKERDTGLLDNAICHGLPNGSQTVVENKIEVIDNVVSGSLQKGSKLNLEDKIEELNSSFNVSNSNPHKHKLKKLSLDSLASDIESLLDPNLSALKEISPLKTSPIKRGVIKAKTKKVYVFDANNEKSTLCKKSIGCTYNTHKQKSEPDISNRNENDESACLNNIKKQKGSCLNDAKTNEKNKKRVSFTVDDQIKTNKKNKKRVSFTVGDQIKTNKKNKKRVSFTVDDQNKTNKKYKKRENFTVDDQTLTASKTHSDCCDSTDGGKELKIARTERKSKAKVSKKCNADIGFIDAISSDVSATNCLENKNREDKSCTIEVSHTNASFSIQGTVLNEQKPSNCSDLNKKCLNKESSNNKFGKSAEVPFRMKNGQTSKGCEAILVEGDKCNSISDGSHATKRSLPKNSKIIPEKESDKDSGCREETNFYDNVEDEINNFTEEKCHNGKAKKCVKRRKHKAKKMSPLKKTGQNTFLVKAEIHPPPSSLNTPKTETVNKENKDLLGLANFQVSVVLKDVFETDNLDACARSESLLKDNILALKNPLSENSCNIQLSRNGSKNTASVASNFEGYSRRRRQDVNYKELSCNKKMRRS